jgi:lysophospholipase L1-like esterase
MPGTTVGSPSTGPGRLGLVALGDSITVGEGNMVCGTPCRSWALWLAELLDLPFTGRAVNGSVVGDVLREQLPRVRAAYDVGCLYVGVNDVRGADWSPASFERDLRGVVEGMGESCARLLMLTAPLDLGRPPAGAKVAELNAATRRAALAAGAAVCSLDDLGGWTYVLPDAVHPTALGQLEIAARAAQALGASAARLPDRRLGPRGRASYGRSHLRMLARDVVRRRVEAARG